MDGNKLSPTFNQLSFAGRLELRTATLATSISGIARKDKAVHPWRGAFYMVYLGFIAAPIPLPGANVVPLLALMGFIWTGATPWARWAKNEMKADFDKAALIKNHQDFIVADPKQPDKFKVRGIALGLYASKTLYRDFASTARDFARYAFG